MKSTSRKTIIFHILGICLLLLSLVAFTGLISGMSSIFADDGGAAAADSGGGDAGGSDAGGGGDAGDGAADSGGEAADSGSEAADSGGEAADAGGEAADAGGEAADAGGEAADAGGEAADSGGDAADAGDEAADAGGEAADSGGDAADAGDEAADSGDEAAASEDTDAEADEGEADSADAVDEDAAGDEGDIELGSPENGASVSTNKSDYAATETPEIAVSYLAPNSNVNVTVTAPDGTVIDMVATTDENGNAVITYAPEGGLQNGEYNVVVTDGATIVTTIFTDAVAYELSQWANTDDAWTTSEITPINSHYTEGDSVPFMMTITEFGSGSRSITITYDYSIDSIGAYDALTVYNSSENWWNSEADPSSPTGNWWGWSTTGVFTYYNTSLSIDGGPTAPSGDPVATSSYSITLNAYNDSNPVYVLWGGYIATGASDLTSSTLHMDTDVTPSADMKASAVYSESCGSSILFSKEGPEYAHVGDIITYTYYLYNEGNYCYGTSYDQAKLQIVDIPVGTIAGSSAHTVYNEHWWTSNFEPGETWVYQVNDFEVPDGVDPLCNDAAVQVEECVGQLVGVWVPGYYWYCWWIEGHYEYQWVYENEWVSKASDSWCVDVLHPGIEIVKTGPETATEGDTIEYTFTVTNTSDDTPLNGVAIIDSLAPAAVYISGDTNLDGWLDPGEAWMFTATYDIPLGTVGDMLNTAIASGTDILGGDKGYVEDDSTWTVAVTALPVIATGGEFAESPLFLVIDVEGNVARYPVTPGGALRVDVIQTSPDGNLVLEIPMGTIVRNPDGSAAYLNADPDVIGIQAGAVAGTGDATVIQAYDLTPEGIYFDNGQATLTVKYNADAVPAGKSLSWAYYDANSGNWVDILTSGTVAAGGEPAAAFNTSSLALFALLAR